MASSEATNLLEIKETLGWGGTLSSETATDEEVISCFYRNPLLTLIFALKHQSSKFEGLADSITYRDNNRLERAFFAYTDLLEGHDEPYYKFCFANINKLVAVTSSTILVELNKRNLSESKDVIYTSAALLIAINYTPPEVYASLCGDKTLSEVLASKLKFLVDYESSSLIEVEFNRELACMIAVNNSVYENTGLAPFYRVKPEALNI